MAAWLSGIGLTCDIVGFALLVLEWWRAYTASREAQVNRLESLAEEQDDILPAPTLSEMENWDRLRFLRWHMKDDHDIEDQARLRPFCFGAALILIGFILQLAGVIVGAA